MADTASDRLIAKARRLIDRQELSSRGVDPALREALDAFESISPDKRFSSLPEYAELSKLISEIETRRREAEWPTALINTVMVALSIVVMISVAQLSIFYEDGQSLASDMRAFQSQRMERRISQLERQLIYAQIDSGQKPGAPVPGQAATAAQTPTVTPVGDGGRRAESALTTELALDRYYELFFDLKDADRSVSQLMDRSKDFWEASYNPVPLLGFVVAPIKNWYFGKDYSDIYLSALPVQPAGKPIVLPKPPSPCDRYQAILTDNRLQQGSLWMRLITDARASCLFSVDNEIKNFSLVLPPMQEQISLVESRLKPYSVWIMPIAFAVFGALTFYMRLILNDLLPNPSFFRVVHRVAISAVAAVVLSLFWSSVVSRGGAFETAGFTIFTVAFLIGFSIDMFFSYLDRSVAVALGVVNKGEKTSSKAKTLADASKA